MNLRKNPVQRFSLYILGLFLVALAIRLSMVANLGTSPSTAFSWTMEKTVGSSVAFWTFLINSLCLVVQIAILRKDFKPIQLLQLAAAFLFSLFLAYLDPLVRWWVPQNYIVRLIQLALAIMLQALGIFLVIKAQLITMPIESMIIVILTKIKGKVGTFRMIFDFTWLILAIILSIVYLQQRHDLNIASLTNIAGIREGTIFLTIFVGMCMNVYEKLLGRQLSRLCGVELPKAEIKLTKTKTK
jgi:uncharacterized protein